MIVRRRRQHGPFRSLTRAIRLGTADREVLRHLEMQPIRAWSRETLCEATSMKDRTVRQCIEHLRRAGVPVTSSSTEPGYKIARTSEEIERFRDQQISRLRVIRSEVDALDQVARLLRDREASGEPVSLLALL